MTAPQTRLVPLLQAGVVTVHGPHPAAALALRVQTAGGGPAPQVLPLGPGSFLLDPLPQEDLTLQILAGGTPVAARPLALQVGGWSGAVDWVQGRMVAGRARNLRDLARDVTVVACNSAGEMAFATAQIGRAHV